MGKTLVILEVSRKQDYIFASKKLRENADRSGDIRYVTGSGFFQETAGELYSESENMVYAGGGHTVLQFPDEGGARAFAAAVTRAVMERFDGLELFVKQLVYDPGKTPGDNLKELSRALERKKSLRAASFRRMSFGVEALEDGVPAPLEPRRPLRSYPSLAAPEGFSYPAEFEKLAGNDNFLAVVHIDGNAMGKRVDRIYQSGSEDWDTCCRRLRRFSEGIQADFERAFRETVEEVIRWAPNALGRDKAPDERDLPIRPVILAGDDVCFVTAGSLGLECARIFLERLTAMKNQEDGAVYAACAGVVLVHRKFPFHQAYDLAEELCSSAKRFGAVLDPEGRISAMDWHIEFGQLKDGLVELRKDYETEDSGRLELRPVTVVVPEGCPDGGVRSYRFFRSMCGALQGEAGNTARGKLKELRTALKQGEVESRFFLHDKEIDHLLYHAFSSEKGEDAVGEAYALLRGGEKSLPKEAFRRLDGVRRCLFFDAIEMLDHCVLEKEAEA